MVQSKSHSKQLSNLFHLFSHASTNCWGDETDSKEYFDQKKGKHLKGQSQNNPNFTGT